MNIVNSNNSFDSLNDDVNLENFSWKNLDAFQETLKPELRYLNCVKKWKEIATEVDKLFNFLITKKF